MKIRYEFSKMDNEKENYKMDANVKGTSDTELYKADGKALYYFLEITFPYLIKEELEEMSNLYAQHSYDNCIRFCDDEFLLRNPSNKDIIYHIQIYNTSPESILISFNEIPFVSEIESRYEIDCFRDIILHIVVNSVTPIVTEDYRLIAKKL